MAHDRDESDGGFVKPDYRHGGSPAPALAFLAPLEIHVDAPDLRYAKLSRVVADHVVPRLLALHERAQNPAAVEADRSQEISDLAKLLLGPENEDATNFVLELKDRGISLDDLHYELLEPTARHIGELWNEDKIDFVDVTLGVGRLQRMVRVFEGLDQIAEQDTKRTVLLAAAPGEQHSLGSTIVQKFLRAGGWHVCTCTTSAIGDAAEIASSEWFAVVGFSLNSDLHIDELATAIARLRARSVNPRIGVMVGGTAFLRHPDWVAKVGADGTAANGPSAVVLARKLLAEGLG